MKTIDITKRAGRNLRQALGRTLLTALAISVGAFTITMAMAAGSGGRQYVDTVINTSGDVYSLMVYARMETPTGPGATTTEGPSEYVENPVVEESSSTSMLLSKADIDKVQAVEGIESVVPMLDISARHITGPNGKRFETALQIKVDKTSLELAAGSLNGDNQLNEGTVTIPESYVESLGFKSATDAIGKEVTIRVDQYAPSPTGEVVSKDFTFTIAAVDTSGSSTLMYMTAVRVSKEDGDAIFRFQAPAESSESYYALIAQVRAGEDVSTVQQRIKDAGYDVFSLEDMREAMFVAVNVAMAGLAGFGALAVLASIFGVINTMYISVLERTQQIGLMKALGMRRRDIGRLFLFEAAWIGFLGGAIGAGSAVVMGSIANPIIASTTGMDGGNLLIFEPLSIIVIIAALMLVAILSGFFPSRKAAKLDPIEALRTE